MKTMIRKSDYAIFSLAVAGILLFFYLYPKLYPDAGIRLDLQKDEIGNIAEKLVTDQGFALGGYRKSTELRRDGQQIKYLYHEFGPSSTVAYVNDKIPAYYWRVEWRGDEALRDKIVTSNEEEAPPDSEEEWEDLLSEIRVDLTTSGEIIAFQSGFRVGDSTEITSADDALMVAQDLFQELLGDSVSLYEYSGVKSDSTHLYTWKRTADLLGETETISIEVAGQRVVSFERDLRPPAKTEAMKENENYLEIPSLFLFIIFFLAIIAIVVIKLRRDEIGVKNAIGISIIASILFIVIILFSASQESYWELLIPLILVPVFLILAYFAVIGAGESLCRDTYPGKLITFDSLQRFKIMYPEFGRSILSGVSLAFIASGLTISLLYLFSRIDGFYLWKSSSNLTEYSVFIPLVYVFASTFISASFGELIFRLFSISFLRRYLNSVILIVCIAATLWVFNFIGHEKYDFAPVHFEMLRRFAIGVLFALFFLRYDLVTVLIGSILYRMIGSIQPMIYWGDTSFDWNFFAFWALLLLLIVVGLLALRRRLREGELLRFEPPYVKRMQERERVRRELEIARRVQLSFLPKDVPHIAGIDVATLCVPALEVGGDYYDFIDIGAGGKKLGVVIGDVSGKGIPAAFHMTLTKGFLKSQAKEDLSPKDILIRINELFYENVERNIFISMILGVFDVSESSFSFARAGHNPIIIRSTKSNSVENLCPKGIALGLEKGEIFNRHIEERKIAIRRGDVFVLYTDGISEAMNERKEEFGPERLEAIVAQQSHLSASEIMSQIQHEVREFTGATEQHDDMTMIIIKIL
jgi:hypothetical protein